MRQPCVIEGCEKPRHALCLCSMHLSRWRRHGDPLKGARELNVYRDPADYPAPTPQPTPCVIWSGPIDRQGYGRRYGKLSAAAHRLVWEQTNGPIPPGLCVMHLCDNRPCVNLAHLRLGTVADNNADKVAKGRSTRGEKSWSVRLTEADVRLIRNSDEMSITLAHRYGVSQPTVRHVRNGRTWRHVV